MAIITHQNKCIQTHKHTKEFWKMMSRNNRMRDLSTCTGTLLNIHNTHKHTTKPASNTHALTTTSHVMEPLKTPLNESKYSRES